MNYWYGLSCLHNIIILREPWNNINNRSLKIVKLIIQAFKLSRSLIFVFCRFSPSISRRRPQTSYAEYHQSFAASPRIKSAKYPAITVAMPRSHVSIARFYDWSEDLGDCVSISKFYRDIAGTQKFNRVRDKGNKWTLNGQQPGRMFLRDKAGLTKGEREIIEGIYKNRGDMPREENSPHLYPRDEWDFVRSHKDAWNIRKHLMNQRTILTSESPFDIRLPEELFSRAQVSQQTTTSKDQCVFCDPNTLKTCVQHREDAPKAPPTTPDRLSAHDSDEDLNTPRMTFSKHFRSKEDSRESESRMRILRKIDPGNKHFNLSRSTNHLDSPRDKKKVFVNVFLPKIPSDQSRELTTTSLAIDSRRNTLIDDKGGVREGLKFSRVLKNENLVAASMQKPSYK